MKYVLIILSVILTISCNTKMEKLKTVDSVEINKYLGKWYEIVRLPNRFEKGLICVTADYSLRKDGKIKVVNSGRRENDITKTETATGNAWVPNQEEPGRLKVQFFWPFSGGYYIFHLDTESYQYALVGDPSRKYFWLLSRTPSISNDLYNKLIAIAEKNGFAIEKFYKTPQRCN